MKLEKGRVQVYTGDGKGKTTAAFGLALRAVGHGLKVTVIQFLKGEVLTGEVRAARLLLGLEVRPRGRDGFIGPEGPTQKDMALAQAALKEAHHVLESGACDVLILDEINVAVSLGLVEEEAVLDLIKNRPDQMELVLTGRNAPPSVMEKADLVTTMMCTKHYFKQGQKARVGIEH